MSSVSSAEKNGDSETIKLFTSLFPRKGETVNHAIYADMLGGKGYAKDVGQNICDYLTKAMPNPIEWEYKEIVVEYVDFKRGIQNYVVGVVMPKGFLELNHKLRQKAVALLNRCHHYENATYKLNKFLIDLGSKNNLIIPMFSVTFERYLLMREYRTVDNARNVSESYIDSSIDKLFSNPVFQKKRNPYTRDQN